MSMSMSLSPRLILGLQCPVCQTCIDPEEQQSDRIIVALFGAVAYAQCPSCKQAVDDHRDQNYRRRVRRWYARQRREITFASLSAKNKLAFINAYFDLNKDQPSRAQCEIAQSLGLLCPPDLTKVVDCEDEFDVDYFEYGNGWADTLRLALFAPDATGDALFSDDEGFRGLLELLAALAEEETQ